MVRSSTPCYRSFNLPMGRSPSFGSTAMNLNRAINTRFRYGFVASLNLAHYSKSQTHYAKGMRSPLRAPTLCRCMISGSISLPSTGFFSPFPHGTGSLSVTDEYLVLEGGPPGFRLRFTCEALLGILLDCVEDFVHGTITRSGSIFQRITLSISFSYQSPATPASKLTGLDWSAFARRY